MNPQHTNLRILIKEVLEDNKLLVIIEAWRHLNRKRRNLLLRLALSLV